jgi:Asp-tRNA(Asn)/Glu-tRNA(Gln) amidotransferase A subunit family amidase
MATEPCLTSAVELARAIREGEQSPVDVVEAHLERIEERDGAVNAYVTVTDERAREAAAEAERAVEAGESLGPLHGVPVAIKDLEDVAGTRTTFGSLLFEDNVSAGSEPFVERLLDAGAIVLGKTNTPEFGLGCTTDNRVAGETHTPFDTSRNAGGSSGGAGAALAAGMAPLAQGSDTGGSIRTPASFCGVYGIKPSFGRVPRVSRPDAFEAQTPFSHVGPMARTVEDAALMLDVMAGPHPEDPFSLPETGEDYLGATERGIEGLDVAYSPDLGTYPVEPEIREVVDDAVDAFEDAGATVERVEVDLGCEQSEVLEAFYTFARVRWQSLFDGLERDGFDPRGADRERLRPVVVETILESPEVTTRAYSRAQRTRTRVYDGLQEVFAEYDLLVSPTLAVLPFPGGEEPAEVDGVEVDPLRGWVLTQPYNMSGHPAASVPAGFVDGLPVGMQVAGRRYADGTVLAASAAFERERPWQDAYERL